MFKYYLNRGLEAIDVLATMFSDRVWWVPDLICDDALESIRARVGRLEFYHINTDFTWAAKVNGNDPKIFYVIDYFGADTRLGRDSPPNTITVRDSVWFPYPFSPVECNQIWFNSLRKIFRGVKGSSLISPYRVDGLTEVPNIFYHSGLTWVEMNRRLENYHFCREAFSKFAVPGHVQAFPSVFPLVLKNRERVLEVIDIPLPGMWQNKYSLPNDLYEKLTFIPLDSRVDKTKLADLAVKIQGVAS